MRNTVRNRIQSSANKLSPLTRMLQSVVVPPVERQQDKTTRGTWLAPLSTCQFRVKLFVLGSRLNISKQPLFAVFVPNLLESGLYDENLKNIYWTTEKEQLEVAVKNNLNQASQRLARKC